MTTQIADKPGFIAALDQSGGSTPGALRLYGVPDGAYDTDAQMFELMHQMRVRIMTAPAFTGSKVIAAILFEATMLGQAKGKPVPAYLWEDRGIVPFLKVDKGLEEEADGVSLMKPMPGLDRLLKTAVDCGIFGTKMRSTIAKASKSGVSAIARQQFELASQIQEFGLVPILEPEVSIKSPEKAASERLLLDALLEGLEGLSSEAMVMIKLTIPDEADFYKPLIVHPRVLRVVALSGGYTREEACQKLSANRGMIASFSRALIGGLRASMDDAAFDAELASAIDQIYRASTVKR